MQKQHGYMKLDPKVEIICNNIDLNAQEHRIKIDNI